MVKEEKYVQGEIRKYLNGTPEEITPHLERIAEESKCKGLNYYIGKQTGSSQFSKKFWLLCGKYQRLIHFIGVNNDKDEDDAREIGEITLQSLPSNKTLFIAKHQSNDFDIDGFYYRNFLGNLFLELKQLGFVETWPRKAWRVIKELIGIAKVAKP